MIYRWEQSFYPPPRTLLRQKPGSLPGRLRPAESQSQRWYRRTSANPVSQEGRMLKIRQSDFSPLHLDVSAIPDLVFRIAALQPEPRLLVTFFVQIMQERRVRAARQLVCEFVNAAEEWQKVWFRINRSHCS